MSEPFFIRHATGLATERMRHDWLEARVDEARKEGVVFSRASCRPDDNTELLFEGWKERPEDQGEQRWPMTDEELRSYIMKARSIAQRGGTMHPLWDTIFDAEALLKGERSIMDRASAEAELRRVVDK